MDDIIVFNTLTREHLAEIVDIQLANVGKLLKDRKLKLEVTAAAKDRIIARATIRNTARGPCGAPSSG